MSKLSAIKIASLLGGLSRFLPARPTPGARDSGWSETDTTNVETLIATMRALAIEANSADRWISRARPTFLYIMYGMILWAIPMGLVTAVSPRISQAIIGGMTGYLSALPDELYTLFGTGYLGYATLRQWGKVKGTDR